MNMTDPNFTLTDLRCDRESRYAFAQVANWLMPARKNAAALTQQLEGDGCLVLNSHAAIVRERNTWHDIARTAENDIRAAADSIIAKRTGGAA